MKCEIDSRIITKSTYSDYYHEKMKMQCTIFPNQCNRNVTKFKRTFGAVLDRATNAEIWDSLEDMRTSSVRDLYGSLLRNAHGGAMNKDSAINSSIE